MRAVGIPVKDVDQALAFYVDTLGFDVRLDTTFGSGQRWVEVAPGGATTTLALVRETSAAPAGIDTHLRLTTTAADVDHAELRSLGVDVDPEVIRDPVPMFVFRDPDGNRLIAVEPPSEKHS